MSDEGVSRSLRHLLAERAAGCCEYCRSPVRYSMQSFSVEHIEPRSRGGPTVAGNLSFSCQGCNNHKYTKTGAADPISGEQVPLFHPRNQRWRDHFAWSEDGTVMLGLTPTGRATVVALQLNRDGLVNLRRLLFAAGEHPPPEPRAEDAANLPVPSAAP
jgi:hypothetical protein